MDPAHAACCLCPSQDALPRPCASSSLLHPCPRPHCRYKAPPGSQTSTTTSHPPLQPACHPSLHGPVHDAGDRHPGAASAARAASPGVVQAGPRHYSVGRAAGLLSGFRRMHTESPALAVGTGHPSATGGLPAMRASLRSLMSASRRRVAGAGGARSASQPPLPTQALCVKDVAPNLQSCELLPDGQGSFQCKADVFLSLRVSDCQSA